MKGDLEKYAAIFVQLFQLSIREIEVVELYRNVQNTYSIAKVVQVDKNVLWKYLLKSFLYFKNKYNFLYAMIKILPACM